MLKRVEITYVGGHKEKIQYREIILDTKEERIYLDTVGTQVTVMKKNVLQFREL